MGDPNYVRDSRRDRRPKLRLPVTQDDMVFTRLGQRVYKFIKGGIVRAGKWEQKDDDTVRAEHLARTIEAEAVLHRNTRVQPTTPNNELASV